MNENYCAFLLYQSSSSCIDHFARGLFQFCAKSKHIKGQVAPQINQFLQNLAYNQEKIYFSIIADFFNKILAIGIISR